MSLPGVGEGKKRDFETKDVNLTNARPRRPERNNSRGRKEILPGRGGIGQRLRDREAFISSVSWAEEEGCGAKVE